MVVVVMVVGVSMLIMVVRLVEVKQRRSAVAARTAVVRGIDAS
jgi:hypothetical protein